MRKTFTMTKAQMDRLLESMKSRPLIMLQCGMPPSQQSRANDAWAILGREMGFDGMTVRPTGNDPLVFSAEPVSAPPTTSESAT